MWPCSGTESSLLTWLITISSQWYDYLVTWITCDMQITAHTSQQNRSRVKWINMPFVSDNLSEPPANHKICNSDKRIAMENFVSLYKSYFIIFHALLVSTFTCNKSVFVMISTIAMSYLKQKVTRGAAAGWGTALQTERSRVRFPMVSL